MRECLAEAVARIKKTSLAELQPRESDSNWSAIMKRATLNECYRHADEFLRLMRQGGFVLLAKAQDVPENPYTLDEGLYRSGQFIGYRDAQVDMYKAGWRKIELER